MYLLGVNLYVGSLFPFFVMGIYCWLWFIRVYLRLEIVKMTRADVFEKFCKSHFIEGYLPLLFWWGRRYLLLLFIWCGWVWLSDQYGELRLWSDVWFLGGVLALSCFDKEYRLLPDPIVFILLWSGVVFSLLGITPLSLEVSIYGVVVAYLVMWGIYLLGWFCYRQEAIGRGDLKFAAAIGAWIGGERILYFLFVSAILGCLWGLFLYVRNPKELKRGVPFGPSLGFSGIIFYFIARFIMTY